MSGKFSVDKNIGFIENSPVFKIKKSLSALRCARLLVESGLCASFYDSTKSECYLDTSGCCNSPGKHSIGSVRLRQYSGLFYRQWVSKVTGFKSQWDDNGWSAAQVKGPPNVYPQYGDIEGTWCLKGESSDHYITIEYSKKTYIQSINIYETYNGGSVWRISFKAPNGTWHTVWEVNRATLSTVTSSRIFSPPIQTVAFPANEVHIEIDTTNTHEHYEMDAVEITGQC
ncbi:F-box/LRR-repeat protein 4-like isoform X1 [Mytilus edulis]|uniref:F-box/LRR-repeat protein 4-like isoform X1 n=1 Tax=Mytilus edulis TaxID=6550 RepID=UPI0039F050C2